MDGSHSLLFRSDSSLALRCRKGGPSTPSFDHLVGAREQLRRYLEAQCSGRLQVDDELEFGRRQVRGLRPSEDLTCVDADLTKHVQVIGPIAHQPAGFDSLASGI